MVQESILLYNMPDPDRRKRLRKALSPLGIPIRYVERREYLQPIGTLAGEKMFFAVEREYDGPELSDPMLVLAGLSSDRVDQVLKSLRESGEGRIPYKAVLTDTNRFWTSVMLFEELKKEHQAFRQNRK